MDMSERILFILENKKISKTEFAKRLKITQAYVSKLVNKGSEPSDRLIDDICEKFNVNEEWLRYGIGEPFIALDRDIQIETFIGNILRDESDNFKRRLISALCSLSEDEWEFLEKKLREIVGTDENGTG